MKRLQYSVLMVNRDVGMGMRKVCQAIAILVFSMLHRHVLSALPACLKGRLLQYKNTAFQQYP